jgi:ABC-type uncharacterized transport system involved in gliding motility auxiliary subunit
MALMSTRKQSKNYSSAALVVSLIAVIATVLLAITRGLVSLEVFTVARVETLNQAVLIGIGLIILGLAAYAIMEPDRVRRFLTGRQARYGSNALIVSIAFLSILVLTNMLVINPDFDLDKSWDLTEDSVNTLAPETLAALQTLPGKVTATAFFSQASNPESATELLTKLRDQSDGKFDYRFINPDLDPQAALGAGITGDGKILLQMGEQKEIVAFASESEILKGLLRLLNPESSVIYFLSGHGERDIEQSGESSMIRARETLESKNYLVKSLNLLVNNEIPDDASVIVIAGPLKPVAASEVELIKEFLQSGGSLIVMEDPVALTDFGEAADPLAEMLAEDWAITFNNDIVIDLNSPQPTTAAAAYYDSTHPVTVNMNNLVAFFPFTRSISTGGAAERITLHPIVQTNERSWGETDFESLTDGGQVGLDDGEAVGPLTLATAAEDPATGARVVVFGTSSFAMDQMFDAYGNGDMFVNSVDWTAEQEVLANITPRTTTERMFNVPSQIHWILILLSSIFIIPGLVLLGGVSTWLQRRRQG